MNVGDAARVFGGFGLGQKGAALGIGGQDRIQQAGRIRGRFLRHRADPRRRADAHRTFVRMGVAQDHSEQGGLARSVAADKAHLSSLRQVEGGFFEQHPSAQAKGHVIHMQHGGVIARPGPSWETPFAGGRSTEFRK